MSARCGTTRSQFKPEVQAPWIRSTVDFPDGLCSVKLSNTSSSPSSGGAIAGEADLSGGKILHRSQSTRRDRLDMCSFDWNWVRVQIPVRI